MKANALLYLFVALFLISCGGTEEEKVSYDDKVTDAIKKHTGAEEIENITKKESINIGAVKQSIESFESAVESYTLSIANAESAIKFAKESLESLGEAGEEAFAEILGAMNEKLRQKNRATIEESELILAFANKKIEEINARVEELKEITKSGADSDTAYHIYSAVINGELKQFAMSPKDDDKVSILFEFWPEYSHLLTGIWEINDYIIFNEDESELNDEQKKIMEEDVLPATLSKKMTYVFNEDGTYTYSRTDSEDEKGTFTISDHFRGYEMELLPDGSEKYFVHVISELTNDKLVERHGSDGYVHYFEFKRK